MFKAFLAILFLTATWAHAQTKFVAESEGRQIGTMSFQQKVGADGSKSVVVQLEIETAKQKFSMRTQNTYDAKGNPTRKFLDANIPGGALQRQVVATFDNRGANIVQIDGGKRTTRQIPLVESAPRANSSEFWLVREKPKVGDAVRCYVFNMDQLAWHLQTVTYRGVKTVKVGGKSVSAHLVETAGDSQSKAYLDDAGVPWLIETAKSVIRRVGV
jgi:hypothetical protein